MKRTRSIIRWPATSKLVGPDKYDPPAERDQFRRAVSARPAVAEVLERRKIPGTVVIAMDADDARLDADRRPDLRAIVPSIVDTGSSRIDRVNVSAVRKQTRRLADNADLEIASNKLPWRGQTGRTGQEAT